MSPKLTTVEIPAQSTARYAVIWLHGLGADGHDFEGIVPALTLTATDNIDFIFPNAPAISVTVNGGMIMPAWYDIVETSLDRQVDIEGIKASADLLIELIQQQQQKGIAPENILLVGFSQGGVIALHTGLRYPERLAGIMALSTYLPTIKELASEQSSVNQHTPIFMAHGKVDTIVPLSIAKAAFKQLQEMNYPIDWHEYPMGHSVCNEEIQDIADFINTVFKR